jgi:hypothetical protein
LWRTSQVTRPGHATFAAGSGQILQPQPSRF